MTITDKLRGLFGKRNGEAAPSHELDSAQSSAAQVLTEQELEFVQGGAGEAAIPIVWYVPASKLESSQAALKQSLSH